MLVVVGVGLLGLWWLVGRSVLRVLGCLLLLPFAAVALLLAVGLGGVAVLAALHAG